MSIFGYLCGGIVSYYMDTTGVFGAYFALAIVHALTMIITVVWTVETPLLIVQSPSSITSGPCPSSPSALLLASSHGMMCVGLVARSGRVTSFAKPFRSHDFRVVFFTRYV
jgi:hypothetical protein